MNRLNSNLLVVGAIVSPLYMRWRERIHATGEGHDQTELSHAFERSA
jgi:hypothetical protein